MFICVGKISKEEFMTKELLIHYSKLRSKTDVVICPPIDVHQSAGFHEKREVITVTINIRLIIVGTLLPD